MILNGKPAVKINAKSVMWGITNKAQLFKIDGEEKWIPRSLCKYDDKEGTLIIEEWFYDKLFEKK